MPGAFCWSTIAAAHTSHSLSQVAFRAADALSFPRDWLAEGIYACVSGPTYESRAEGRFLRAAGADVVGMSTYHEVVAAKSAVSHLASLPSFVLRSSPMA